jgi:flagellar biosynthesis/type III secretory pathway M-ring protein FliF/YscJ
MHDISFSGPPSLKVQSAAWLSRIRRRNTIMSTAPVLVSDMLVTVKSREMQRAMLADMRGDREAARRHFLASAHLELVLAADYEQAGDSLLSFRSQLSAASCFWRAGDYEQAQRQLENLRATHPDQTAAIEQAQMELTRDCPPSAS